MLKGIQGKLVLMFVLLILAVMLVFGLFLQIRISAFYHDSFLQAMRQSFSLELTNELQTAAQSEDSLTELDKTLALYSGRMGISTNRNYYILSKKTAAVLRGSDNVTALERSDNMLAAMAGKTGDYISQSLPYVDYAIGIGDNYIIYIKDKKEEMFEIMRTIYIIVGQALLIGILISVVLGFFLSRTITRPISNLTTKAESLAKGSYDTIIEVKAQDEIGKLAATFNYMTSTIESTMEAIAQEKNKLETMFRYMTDGVIAFDIDQKVIHINPAAQSMLKIADESTLVFDDYFKSLGVDICMAQMLYIDRHATLERKLETNGKHFNAYFATFETDEEKLSGVIVVLQDITEAQQLELSRREFVANVSHELRTPLTSIKTYSETLHAFASGGDEKKFLEVIIREVDRMTRIVRDLLALSSLDSKKYAANFEFFSLNGLLCDITERLSVDAAKRNHSLEYAPSTSMPDIYADRDRIEQVITNIISNAIKYTPDGGKVEIYAGYLYNEVYIKIKDNGMGIYQKDLDRIFERFYRADKARSREHGGTGLGLAIAKNFIELHGGTIKINSQYGVGTEVLIKLPIPKKDDPEGGNAF
ncbi:MAG: cell wall metabolism sensor histidine kinase WalK [Firmicutes bacterium]|nr:cell wall metabolism sensor histidine kinase WalK [Bacillota bacterium]